MLIKPRFTPIFFCVLLCVAGIIGCHGQIAAKKVRNYESFDDTIVQISTLQALIQGAYDQATSYEDLSPYGDFGIGTFNALDGEMIMVDNNLFQIDNNGVAHRISRNAGTPFAMVTHFNADKHLQITAPIDLKTLYQKIDDQLPSENIFYAIKFCGSFKKIRARSVAKQKKPYPPLTQIVKKQSVFTYENVQGELVGFRLPEFMAKSNMAGYHFHFLTSEQKAGGHLLGCEITSGTVYVDMITNLKIMLPKNRTFFEKRTGQVTEKDVQQVESLRE